MNFRISHKVSPKVTWFFNNHKFVDICKQVNDDINL